MSFLVSLNNKFEGFNLDQEYSTDMQSLTFQWYTNNVYADRGFKVILKHKDSRKLIWI